MSRLDLTHNCIIFLFCIIDRQDQPPSYPIVFPLKRKKIMICSQPTHSKQFHFLPFILIMMWWDQFYFIFPLLVFYSCYMGWGHRRKGGSSFSHTQHSQCEVPIHIAPCIHNMSEMHQKQMCQLLVCAPPASCIQENVTYDLTIKHSAYPVIINMPPFLYMLYRGKMDGISSIPTSYSYHNIM